MGFGNPGVARWDSPDWGTIFPEVGTLVQVDATLRETVDALAAIDGLVVAADVEQQAAVDGLVLATLSQSAGVDFAPALPPLSILADTEAKPFILARLVLPGGTLNVAAREWCALGAVFDPRLIGSGDVLRTLTNGTDDVQLVLDDTDTDGQVRLRDTFAANDPEGSRVTLWLGEPRFVDADYLVIFEGKVESVNFTDTQVRMTVIRQESVEDRLLGLLVDQASFPSAPPESVGRMIPVVFGEVDASEAVVIDSLAKSSLFAGLLVSDNTVLINPADADRFPPAGLIVIEGEQITYGGKSPTVPYQLVAINRGANGTTSAFHERGAVVEELGVFQVQFAQHTLPKIENVRLLLPSGDLGEAVPQPDTIDTTNALATWSELPKIRDPEALPVYQRVQFRERDPFNTAVDPQFAARENVGYEAFKTSSLTGAQSLRLLVNTEGLGNPGDIKKVWLGIVFDPTNVGTLASVVARVAGVNFALQPTDITPPEIARNDEKTGDRFYDIPPPTLNVQAPASQPFTLTPSTVIHPGIWVTQALAKVVVDKDEDTCAAYAFVGIGEVAIVGTADAIFQIPEGGALNDAIGEISDAKIVFIAGWEQTPFSSHFDVWLRKDGVEIPGTRFKACTMNASFCTGLIRGKERFEHGISPEVAAMIDEDVEWVVHPALGVSNGLWVGCELFIEGSATPPPPAISVEQDARNTVTNYFEVTDLVGRQASPTGVPVLDWDWFGDVDEGGRVILSSFAGPTTTTQIIEIFYVVEFAPFVEVSTGAPRVFADVIGIQPDGNPVEIARALVTAGAPLGLALPSSRIDEGSYFTAGTSLVADAIRAGFSVYVQTSILALLAELSNQTDTRQTWDESKHRIVRRPRADTALPTVLNICTDDLMTNKRMILKRSSLDNVRNRFVIKWRFYAPGGDTSRTETQTGTTVAAFGVQERELSLGLVSDDASAQLVAARKLERMERPRWLVEFDMPIYALGLRRGDLVNLTSRDFDFQVGEVTQLNIAARGFKRVTVSVAVWLK